MKLLIISPGKAHDGTVEAGIAEFAKRIPKQFDLTWAHPKPDTVDTEGAAILKLIDNGRLPAGRQDYVVLLDERGKDIDTPAFAKIIESRQSQGTKRLVFIIGGAFGVNAAVKERADATIKLSSLVFPHMLVRFIVVEQIYRAVSILEGGKYHHA